MKVSSWIPVYEVDGVEPVNMEEVVIEVQAHWSLKDRAVLVMPDGKKYTVIRSDMDKAMSNAGNCR